LIDAAKQRWPDHPKLFKDGKLQHDYGFVAEIGRAVFILKHAPPSVECWTVSRRQSWRFAVIAMGGKGRWDAVNSSLDFPAGTAFEDIQQKVESAIEKADKQNKKAPPQVILMPEAATIHSRGGVAMLAMGIMKSRIALLSWK